MFAFIQKQRTLSLLFSDHVHGLHRGKFHAHIQPT